MTAPYGAIFAIWSAVQPMSRREGASDLWWVRMGTQSGSAIGSFSEVAVSADPCHLRPAPGLS